VPNGARRARYQGAVSSKWATSFYGFVELDAMHDSTQSLSDAIRNTILLRPDVAAGRNGRTRFTVRNARFRFNVAAPRFAGTGAYFRLIGNVDFVNPSISASRKSATRSGRRDLDGSRRWKAGPGTS